ncbi:MAG: hypothetical protein [Microviridae sp.]|nr:MAG: hypothetical protein [Microviridae sp.]
MTKRRSAMPTCSHQQMTKLLSALWRLLHLIRQRKSTNFPPTSRYINSVYGMIQTVQLHHLRIQLTLEKPLNSLQENNYVRNETQLS